MESLDSLLARASSITADTRALAAGSLFFAIRGEKFDGHGSLAEAARRGAIGAVVEREVPGAPLPTVRVAHTRAAFARASARFFGNPSHYLRLVGITGTNGKTTTAYLLRQAFQRLEGTAGFIGTIGTWIGEEKLDTALTTPGSYELQQLLRRMVDAGVRSAAMEVSSIGLDQYRVEGCRFAVAVFTNLTPDHLDYHGTLENYFEAKARLFEDHEVGTSVILVDGDAGWRLFDRLRQLGRPVNAVSVRGNRFASVRGRWCSVGRSGGVVEITADGGISLQFSVGLFGDHNLANVASAWVALRTLGYSPQTAADALTGVKAPPGRLEPVVLPGRTPAPSVFVDYAHTEDGLETTLTTLRKLIQDGGEASARRLITVFGCGGDRDRAKRPRMGEVAGRLSDVVVLTSDNPRTEDPEAILDAIEAGIVSRLVIREADRRAAIRLALTLASSEDIVLIAGKGHEAVQTIGTENHAFRDADVATEIWASKQRQPQ